MFQYIKSKSHIHEKTPQKRYGSVLALSVTIRSARSVHADLSIVTAIIRCSICISVANLDNY